MTKNAGDDDYILNSPSGWTIILIYSTIISLIFLCLINLCYFIIYFSFWRHSERQQLQNHEQQENEHL